MLLFRRAVSTFSRGPQDAVLTQISAFPHLGVTLVLLCIFMLITEPPHHGIPVEWPKAGHLGLLQKANREDAIRITITRDGSVYFRNFRVTFGELLSDIKESLHEGAERRVYLLVDPRARYSDLTPVIDQISAAHIQEVAFFARNGLDPFPHASATRASATPSLAPLPISS